MDAYDMNKSQRDVHEMNIHRIDPRLPSAIAVYLSANPSETANALARSLGRPPRGGYVDRAFLLAPDRFGERLEPLLRSARAIVEEHDEQALHAGLPTSASANEDWRERSTKIAQASLARRISPRANDPAPVLHWCGGSLFVCVPTAIPGADSVAAIRVWLSYSNEVVCARATRVHRHKGESAGGAEERIRRMEAAGVSPTVWRCELPSFCQASMPIAVEITPNPTSFMHAMFIAHRGAGTIVVGCATGVGSTLDWNDEDPSSIPRVRMLPSGWSYLKPDRSAGSSAPIFPYGAPVPINAVFLPNETLFRAIVRATWTVTFPDALRVAFAD